MKTFEFSQSTQRDLHSLRNDEYREAELEILQTTQDQLSRETNRDGVLKAQEGAKAGLDFLWSSIESTEIKSHHKYRVEAALTEMIGYRLRQINELIQQ